MFKSDGNQNLVYGCNIYGDLHVLEDVTYMETYMFLSSKCHIPWSKVIYEFNLYDASSQCWQL